jgi:hypothetical protein
MIAVSPYAAGGEADLAEMVPVRPAARTGTGRRAGVSPPATAAPRHWARTMS